ncbi:MAG: M24 family metallopeptidase [Candidatus Hodarchaeales archaeon]
MKSYLDQLMTEKNVDTLVVLGKGESNPPFSYMTRSAKLGHSSIIVKKRNESALLVHTPMERDSVLETGLKTLSYPEAIPEYYAIIKNEPDAGLRDAKHLESLLNQVGVEGTISVHGFLESGHAYRILSFLQKKASFAIYDGSEDIIKLARQIKDSEEVNRIDRIAKATGDVLSAIRSFLGSLREEEGYAINADGRRVSLGDLRELIRFELFKHVLFENDSTIVSMGRDAGVPHNRGNDNDLLKVGNAIIMDIFPHEPNGYFFDCTRTFCLGYAPSEVEALYSDVLETQETILNEIELNVAHGQLYARTCELFEQQGHPTSRTVPDTTDGFCHGLGHGIGLEIHETPFIGLAKLKDTKSVTRVGEVFTVEPGLYYPGKGMGVRIEDVVAIAEDGVKNLSPFPKDLIVPLRR